MGTTIRATTSKRGKYWLSKNRNLELRHFCLQYHEWLAAYSRLDGATRPATDTRVPGGSYSDATESIAEKRLKLRRKMDLVTETADMAGGDISAYLFAGVTDGLSYSQLRARYEIPCGREMYYERYRLFFWMLDKRLDSLFS